MPTPEEIAREVENQIDYTPGADRFHVPRELPEETKAIDHNRRVIAKAIAAERERCIQVLVLNAVRTWPGGLGDYVPAMVAKIREA